MTSWIDGSFVYSTSEAWVNAMRSFQVPSAATPASLRTLTLYTYVLHTLYTSIYKYILALHYSYVTLF